VPPSKTTPELWHRRLGHLGYGNMAKLAGGMVKGLDLAPAECRAKQADNCEPCILAKQTRLPFNASESTTERPLQLIHMDICGPLIESINGARYIATLLDDYSSYSEVVPTASKSAAHTAAAVKSKLALWENQTGQRVSVVRTDNGERVRQQGAGQLLCR